MRRNISCYERHFFCCAAVKKASSRPPPQASFGFIKTRLENDNWDAGTEGLRAVERITGVSSGQRWDFSSTCQPRPPKFDYLYLRVGSNRALLSALEICQPAREECCHCTSADWKRCTRHITVLFKTLKPPVAPLFKVLVGVFIGTEET